MGEEELGAELVGEEELDEVEGLKVAVGGDSSPPLQEAQEVQREEGEAHLSAR